MSGDVDDGQQATHGSQFAMQVESGHTTKLHIEEQAVRLGVILASQKGFGGGKSGAPNARSGQEPLDRPAQTWVIIDKSYVDRCVLAHLAGSLAGARVSLR